MKWDFSRFVVIVGILAFFLAGTVCIAQETDTTADTEATSTTAETVPQANTQEETAYTNAQPSINRQTGSYESARLISIRLDTESTTYSGTQKQFYEVEVRSGAFEGQRFVISSDVDANPYQIQPREGDKLVVFIQQDDQGNPLLFLEGFDRRAPMLWLIAIFVLTLVLLSGWQGLKVALSIMISIGIIGWILIPAFLHGVNPVPIAAILATVLTFISTGLSLGWNKKSHITALGTFGGVVVAYLISFAFADWAHLSGLATEEDRLFFAQNPNLNPHGLLFAGIIIAAMGVIEDVAVSIASGVEQVAKTQSSPKFKALFTAGMIVGKDHMAAMANTLIFAYVGASLSTLLLYTQYDSNWLKFLNFESVSVEVVQALGATIGLIFTVPITAALSAWFSLPSALRHKKKSLIHHR